MDISAIRDFPLSPGVYIMRNSSGRIIYVGKAKSLKKRVSQYFLLDRDVKTRALVSHIASIEYIITGSEYEALILENNLIKKHQPRYNIDLKDDKTYQMIKITSEDFPRVIKTRKKINDGSVYYGPFPKGRDLDLYFNMLENTYSFRRCKNSLKKRERPCLYYHIGKCLAPCIGKADKTLYRNEIIAIEHMLEGDTRAIEDNLNKAMREHAKRMEFEEAQKIKDTLSALKKISSCQTVSNMPNKDNKDYISFYKVNAYISVQIMQYRNGNLLGNASYYKETFANYEDVIENFILQYYNNSDELSQVIYLPFELSRSLFEQYFSEKFEKQVRFEYPKDGRDYRILKLCELNAKNDVEKHLKKLNIDTSELDDEQTNLYTNEENYKESFYKILTSLPKVGEKTAKKIMEEYGSVDEMLFDTEEGISSKIAISLDTVKMIKERLKAF